VYRAKVRDKTLGRESNSESRHVSGAELCLTLCVLLCGLLLPSQAQEQRSSPTQPGQSNAGKASGTNVPAQMANQAPGTVTGTVEDQSGAVSVGVTVHLTQKGQSAVPDAVTGDNGQFSFTHIAPGPFHLKITAPGFTGHEIDGELQPGQFYITPLIVLAVAGGETEVRVSLTPVEIAEQQIKEEEKQRVLGFIPNFYVIYEPDPVPLNARQKFKLAWRSSTDPVTFIGVGVLAGFEQASDDFSGYGQGMQGYGKRFGAAYADVFGGTFIGSAILPSLLKQDPRYFYKGTGSVKSRIGYALANAVICKGDNKRWQPNYSSILGSFAVGGISYLYYPSSDRSAGLLVQNSMLRLGESALAGVVQEFVVRRLTAHVRNQDKDRP